MNFRRTDLKLGHDKLDVRELVDVCAHDQNRHMRVPLIFPSALRNGLKPVLDTTIGVIFGQIKDDDVHRPIREVHGTCAKGRFYTREPLK